MKQVSLKDFTVEFLPDTAKREDISDELYFSNYAKYVSASKLHKISPFRNGSKDQYYDTTPQEWKPCFIVGDSIHKLLLQREDYCLAPNISKPGNKLGAVIDEILHQRRKGKSIEDAINKACKKVNYYTKSPATARKKIFTKANLEYYLKASQYSNSYIIPSSADYDMIQGCVQSVLGNRVIYKQLVPTDVFGDPLEAHCEDTIFGDFKVTYKDQEYIIHGRGKIDHWSIDPENKRLCLNDVKTSFDPLVDDWMTAGHGYRLEYHLQFMYYLTMLKAYCEKHFGFDDTWTTKTHVWAVQTRNNWFSRCYNVPDELMEEGKALYEKCLKMVAYYELNGGAAAEEVEFID